MEITHPYLRMAVGALLAAGLVSACSGGGSGSGAAAPMPDPDPEPPARMVTYTGLDGMPSENCGTGQSNENCIITTVEGDERTVRRVETATDMTAMERTQTVTVSGTMRTITVTDTMDGRGNRVKSVEMQTCTGGENCVRTSLATYTYENDADREPTIATDTYRDGRLVSSGGTTIAYSSSGGGRTETTVVTGAGTRVQTFSQYSGGTATSTVFTHTGGLIVTTMNAVGMRVETTYATTARETPVSMRVGAPAMDDDGNRLDTGFADGTMVTRTVFVLMPAEAGGRTLVETAWTMTVGSDDPEVVASRTYITARDAQGRPTERRTFMVDANNADTPTVLRSVSTDYPEADATMPETMVTTTEYNNPADRTEVSRTTVVTTDGDGEATAVVRAGTVSAGEMITSTVTSSDGLTVATTYGPGHEAGARDGQTDTVVTNAAGTEAVTTTSTGTGESRMVSMVVTRDEVGVETMRVQYLDANGMVVFAAEPPTRETITTAYRPDGGSTVTTVTAERNAEDEYEDGNTVVVTRDSMSRTVLSVTTNAEDEEIDRTTTTYTAENTSTSRREYYSHVLDAMGEITTRDMVKDVNIVERAAPDAMGVRAITSDLVFYPGAQAEANNAAISDAQYAAVQAGLTPRSNSRTLMGQAILHLDYDDDDAFSSWHASAGTLFDTDLEMEVVTRSPICAAAGCTYSRLRAGTALAPSFTEIRLYNSVDGDVTGASGDFPNGNNGLEGAALINTDVSVMNGIRDVSQPFWHNVGQNNMPDAEYSGAGPLNTQGVLLQLLADLLDIGGAGLSAEYTANTAAADAAPNYRFVAAPASTADALDRNTYTYLETAETGVLGIGRQVKEIDSYLDLGGTRGADADDPMDDVAVRVEVENYFGWMTNSMFTVRRVTAKNVDGYDWAHSSDDWPADGADAAERVRAYVGMVSGDPSSNPLERVADGMTDPGTWTGSMIGVGTIHGERYRGDAKVSVNFNNNNVTTEFSGIGLDRAGLSDTESSRLILSLAPELLDGISFTGSSDGIENGGYTSDTLTGGMEPYSTENRTASTLSGQFYGPEAAEVAGTFNAFGLAVGGKADAAVGDTLDADANQALLMELRTNRGDIVGAFGAVRDPMTETEEDN